MHFWAEIQPMAEASLQSRKDQTFQVWKIITSHIKCVLRQTVRALTTNKIATTRNAASAFRVAFHLPCKGKAGIFHSLKKKKKKRVLKNAPGLVVEANFVKSHDCIKAQLWHALSHILVTLSILATSAFSINSTQPAQSTNLQPWFQVVRKHKMVLCKNNLAVYFSPKTLNI